MIDRLSRGISSAIEEGKRKELVNLRATECYSWLNDETIAVVDKLGKVPLLKLKVAVEQLKEEGYGISSVAGISNDGMMGATDRFIIVVSKG